MQIFTRVTRYTSILAVFVCPLLVNAEWTVDFSRRSQTMGKEASVASSDTRETDVSFVDQAFKKSVPTQDIVILNTDKGFVPGVVRIREGNQYRIVVVNVNEKARNVSFVLDAFSEHHATFYGEVKSFYVIPKKPGSYTFVSPETAARGEIVVHPALQKSPDLRSPASVEGE